MRDEAILGGVEPNLGEAGESARTRRSRFGGREPTRAGRRGGGRRGIGRSCSSRSSPASAGVGRQRRRFSNVAMWPPKSKSAAKSGSSERVSSKLFEETFDDAGAEGGREGRCEDADRAGEAGKCDDDGERGRGLSSRLGRLGEDVVDWRKMDENSDEPSFDQFCRRLYSPPACRGDSAAARALATIDARATSNVSSGGIGSGGTLGAVGVGGGVAPRLLAPERADERDGVDRLSRRKLPKKLSFVLPPSPVSRDAVWARLRVFRFPLDVVGEGGTELAARIGSARDAGAGSGRTSGNG